MGIKILSLIPFGEDQKKMIEMAVASHEKEGAELIYADEKNVLPKMIEEADIIFGNPAPNLLSHAKKLKWLQLRSAGSNQYAKAGLLLEGAVLTSASGAYGLAVSEHLLAMTLAMFKKLHFYRDNQNTSKWQAEGEVRTILGSTVLIVGLGDIGSQYAQKIKLLGGKTIGIAHSNLNKRDFIDEVYLTEKLDEMIPRADVVALCLPSTPKTKHIINEARLRLFKKDSFLFNAGRGDAIDTEALLTSLKQKRLAGVGMDVTDPEPLPEGHLLWKMPEAIITPHVAGGFNLLETEKNVANMCVKNLHDFFEDRKSLIARGVKFE